MIKAIPAKKRIGLPAGMGGLVASGISMFLKIPRFPLCVATALPADNSSSVA